MNQPPEPEVLPITWDFGLVIVSYCVSVMSSYSAVCILQMRFSIAMVVLASACLSCSGIWCMHFIGMAAYQIPTHLEYDVGWTIFSLLVAFSCTTAAFLLLNSKLRRMEIEHGADAVEEENTIEGNIAALKNAPHTHMILSAAIIALGVCAMHYTGMHSIVSEAKPKIRWGIVFASVFIALVAATAALYFAFILPVTKHFASLTAMVMGMAVCGMHYTGMHGMVYELDPALRTKSTTDLTDVVPYTIFLSCGLSFLATSVASQQYRLKLREAVVGAQELAHKIANAEFKHVSPEEVAAERDKYAGFREVLALKDAFVTMQTELTRLKAFLPPPMLAAFNAGHSESEDDGEFSLDRSSPSISRISPATSPRIGPASTHFEMIPDTHESDRESVQSDDILVADLTTVEKKDGPFSPATETTAVVFNPLRSPLHRHTDGAGRVSELNKFRRRECSLLCLRITNSTGTKTKTKQYFENISKEVLWRATNCVMENNGVVEQLRPDTFIASFNAHSRCVMHRHMAVKAAFSISQSITEEAFLTQAIRFGIAVDSSEHLIGTCGGDEHRATVVLGNAFDNVPSLATVARDEYLAHVVATDVVTKSLPSAYITLPRGRCVPERKIQHHSENNF